MKAKTIIALIIAIISITSSIWASDNFSSHQDKTYAPIEVSIGNGKDAKKYLLMNNGLDQYRWYYASLNPQLYEYGSPLEPDLTMIKFQRVNKNNRGKLYEGALFYCSFDIGADEAVLKKLKKSIPKEIDQNKVRLSVIPLEGIELSFINPNNKKSISIIATSTSGIAPIQNDSRVIFNTVLDRESTILMDTLLNTNIGVEYSIKYHYSVFSKPQTKNLTAKVNRNKIVISGYPNDLDSNLLKYLKDKENNPKFLQILKSENDKESKQNKNTISSEKKEEVNLKNIGHKNKSKASKISNQSLSEFQKVINFTYRIREDKILAASGFISFEKYGEKIQKKKIIQDTSYLNWNYSYLLMPSINNRTSEEIKQINMLIELMYKNKVLEKRNYTWNKERGWRNTESDSPTTIDKFNLDSVYSESSSDPLKNSNFRVSTKIDFNGDDDLKTEIKLPVVNGETPITTPFALCDITTFDFTNLTWDGLKTDKSRLISMEINLKDDKRRIKRIIQNQDIKGTKAVEYPSFLYLLTNINSFNEGKMKANIYFKKADGKKIPWEYNDFVLNKYMTSPYIMFFDEEWKDK